MNYFLPLLVPRSGRAPLLVKEELSLLAIALLLLLPSSSQSRFQTASGYVESLPLLPKPPPLHLVLPLCLCPCPACLQSPQPGGGSEFFLSHFRHRGNPLKIFVGSIPSHYRERERDPPPPRRSGPILKHAILASRSRGNGCFINAYVQR